MPITINYHEKTPESLPEKWKQIKTDNDQYRKFEERLNRKKAFIYSIKMYVKYIFSSRYRNAFAKDKANLSEKKMIHYIKKPKPPQIQKVTSAVPVIRFKDQPGDEIISQSLRALKQDLARANQLVDNEKLQNSKKVNFLFKHFSPDFAHELSEILVGLNMRPQFKEFLSLLQEKGNYEQAVPSLLKACAKFNHHDLSAILYQDLKEKGFAQAKAHLWWQEAASHHALALVEIILENQIFDPPNLIPKQDFFPYMIEQAFQNFSEKNPTFKVGSPREKQLKEWEKLKEFIVELGDRVYAKDPSLIDKKDSLTEKTPLYIAIECGFPRFVEWLLLKGVSLKELTTNPLEICRLPKNGSLFADLGGSACAKLIIQADKDREICLQARLVDAQESRMMRGPQFDEEIFERFQGGYSNQNF